VQVLGSPTNNVDPEHSIKHKSASGNAVTYNLLCFADRNRWRVGLRPFPTPPPPREDQNYQAGPADSKYPASQSPGDINSLAVSLGFADRNRWHVGMRPFHMAVRPPPPPTEDCTKQAWVAVQ
jgi:hypothetical protein